MKVSKLDQMFQEDYVWHVTEEDEREFLSSLEGLSYDKESMLQSDSLGSYE